MDVVAIDRADHQGDARRYLVGTPPDTSRVTPRLRIGMVSTYPPTLCGLATFSAALRSALVGHGHRVDIVRVDDAGGATPDGAVGAVLAPGSAESMSEPLRVLDAAELQAIADFANEHDLLIFSDEMYEKILYDGHTHTSIATLPGMAERTLIFNGFSKAYAMTGWRLGYVAGPKPYISQVEKVHSHSATCATSFVQEAGVVALTGPQEFIGEMVEAWDRRRRAVASGLNNVKGVTCPLVEGAFYAFPDIRATGMSSSDAADLLLREAHVALTPGVAFGQAGEGHLRLSFTTSDEELAKAVERITSVLGAKPS